MEHYDFNDPGHIVTLDKLHSNGPTSSLLFTSDLHGFLPWLHTDFRGPLRVGMGATKIKMKYVVSEVLEKYNDVCLKVRYLGDAQLEVLEIILVNDAWIEYSKGPPSISDFADDIPF